MSKDFMKIYKKTVKHIREFKPVHERIEEYINLLNDFYDVSFLTHGTQYTKKKIKKKLESMGILGNYTDIIITDKPKAGFDFDYFIDDNPLMVADMKRYPEKTLFLIPATYNYYLPDLYDNVIKGKNWKQITDYLMTEVF